MLQVDAARHPAGRALRLLSAALHGGFGQRLALGRWAEAWQMAMRTHLALLGPGEPGPVVEGELDLKQVTLLQL